MLHAGFEFIRDKGDAALKKSPFTEIKKRALEVGTKLAAGAS